MNENEQMGNVTASESLCVALRCVALRCVALRCVALFVCARTVAVAYFDGLRIGLFVYEHKVDIRIAFPSETLDFEPGKAQILVNDKNGIIEKILMDGGGASLLIFRLPPQNLPQFRASEVFRLLQ